MTRSRSLLARPAGLAASALALALSLGSGPAFAAAAGPGHPARAGAAAQTAPAGTVFHRLTLLNGWVSSQSDWDSGDPRVGASNGVVYLSGSLHLPSGTNEHFANLPAADWPSHYLYFPIYSYGGGEGSLEIDPSGHMYLFGGGTQSYSSLAGVSFPLTLTSRKLTLKNGWQSGQAAHLTGDPRVAVSNGVVYLSGSLVQPSGPAGAFAVLPKADRPSHYLYLPVYTYGGGEGSLEISPQGGLSVWGTGSTAYSSLAGISFPLTLASQKLALKNGWQSAQGSYHTGSPRASVSNGVVHLSGSAWLPSGTAATLAALPVACRPAHWLYLPVYTLDGTEGSLVISPSGRVSASGSSSAGFTSLAGIHYPLGS